VYQKTHNYYWLEIKNDRLTSFTPWILNYECKGRKRDYEDSVYQQVDEVTILAKLLPLVMQQAPHKRMSQQIQTFALHL
jgi:hypothetical protein